MSARNEVESMGWLAVAWLNGLAQVNDLVGYPDSNGYKLLQWGISRWPDLVHEGWTAHVLGELPPANTEEADATGVRAL